jgi:hypothetical protein
LITFPRCSRESTLRQRQRSLSRAKAPEKWRTRNFSSNLHSPTV